MVKKIFWPKTGEEVTVEKWKLHNEELHDLYSTPNITWETGRECGTYGGEESSTQGLDWET
jgi:hypothetical protein